MEEQNEVFEIKNKSLLDIFVSKEDKEGFDLLKMSNYFDVFIGHISDDVNENGIWEIIKDSHDFIGQIASAIKGGFDISKLGMLIVDTSHFSKEIVEGLKSGIYHMGESKEIAGHLRPAILDENERLVKFVTLKKAINLSELLSDISTLSMQVSLKNINEQIENVGRDVNGISEFIRREKLSNKFLYAREKIMNAANSEQEYDKYLHEADTYLIEGLIDLYADINEEINNLITLKGPFTSLKAVDNALTHINEDMQMIPRYVGLRVYLYNFCGKNDDVKHVIEQYRNQLENLYSKQVCDNKYTALEIIHKYYPYSNEDMDFWLEQPKQMIEVLKSYENMIEQKTNDVFYIEAEAEERYYE